MARELHTVTIIGGADLPAYEDRLHVGKIAALAYPAGASAGAPSTAAFVGNIPPGALILTGTVAGATVAAAQTPTGATITVTPTTGTLAAGSVGVLIIA